MATKSGLNARTNALVGVLATLGILVLVNVIGVWVFGRLDLTDNRRYTLSEVSKAAVRALDQLDVQVFISKELPPTIQQGYGQERDIRGVDREFLDKLYEYQSYSNGNMTVTVVQDDVEAKAEKAKLDLFTGKKAEFADGRLEFKKYALGATFQYRNQMEVFPLALEPEYYEFEITKILMRLKEKYEKSAGMKDVLEAGKAIAEAAKACNDKLESFRKEDGGSAGLSALVGGGGDIVAALRAGRSEFKKACDQVAAAVEAAKARKGKDENLDQLIEDGRVYAQTVDELARQVEGGEAKPREVSATVERLVSLYPVLDRDHDTLKNSPGRKAIGYMCGHREFCPFADEKPLIRPEIAGLLGQKNPLVQNFVAQAKQIEDQINMINEQIRRGLFTRRGLTVKRVDAGEDIPDDVEVLVVHGPQRPLSDRDLYNIDQFLLSGRSVIFFLSNWDVAVYNIRKGGDSFDPSDLTFDDLHREARPTNLDSFLAHYGVKVNRDLVVEPKSFEDITVIQVQRQGQFTIQNQRDFPYPLLPTFTDMDRSHVLVRRLATITLPYVSTLSIADSVRGNPSMEAVELIRTSAEATATNEDLPLSPPMLLRHLGSLAPNGPHTVAAVLKGEFRSYFEGKEIPKRPEKSDEDRDMPRPKPVDRPFRASGTGRLLVIASDMGLENLSSERVFEGFNMSQLTSGTADFFMKLRDYVANFQNWQLRISQIAPVIQANLDFIYNCLDWGVANEALVDIRSKGVIRRPIETLSGAARTAVTLGLIVGLPLAFAAFGVVRFAARRKRG